MISKIGTYRAPIAQISHAFEFEHDCMEAGDRATHGAVAEDTKALFS